MNMTAAKTAHTVEPPELSVEWRPDCQGKWDYDADLVRLSCRYYPRGGGFHTFDTRNGTWAGNEARPEISPRAHCDIYLGTGCDHELASVTFDGSTEAEVRGKVEAWAREQFARLSAALRAIASGQHVVVPREVWDQVVRALHDGRRALTQVPASFGYAYDILPRLDKALAAYKEQSK